MLFYKELSRKDTGFQNISILPSPEHDGWLGTVVNWVCGREETYWVFMEPRAGLRPGTPQKRHFDCDYQCTHVFILKCRGDSISTTVQNVMLLTKSSACSARTMFYPLAVHPGNNLWIWPGVITSVSLELILSRAGDSFLCIALGESGTFHVLVRRLKSQAGRRAQPVGHDPLEVDWPFHRGGMPDTLYSRYLHYDSQQRQN